MDAQIELSAFIEAGDLRIFFHVPNQGTLWRVKTFWEKEPDTLRWIHTFKPEDLLLDIGANIGLYTLYAAAVQGVRVLAFEPESLNYALLNRNIFLNQMAHKVQAYPLALSDETAMSMLHLSDFYDGGSCHNFKEKVNFQHKAFRPRFSQGCISATLDSLIYDHHIPFPQHIKIDVDGIEHKIIRGASKTLENPLLKSVLVELNTNVSEHREVVELMEEKGFTFSQLQVDAHIEKEEPFQGIGNYIFFREAESEWGRYFSFLRT